MIERVATSASRSLLSRLPESACDGSVHSAYERAVNVTWEGDGWGSLLDSALPLNPWGIRVPDLPGVAPGDRIRISRREIAFHGREVRIRLDAARPEDLRIARPPVVRRDLLKERTGYLREWLETRKIGPSFLDCLGPSGRPCRDPFLEKGSEVIDGARRARSPEDRARRLSGLVGLGLGLTPAGDDFLAGHLAASLLSGDVGGERGILVRVLPDLARGRTTEVGARMLMAACRDEFAAPVIRLVESLARPGNGVLGAARDLLTLGGTSGADTLAGVLFSAGTVWRQPGPTACRTSPTSPSFQTGQTGPREVA